MYSEDKLNKNELIEEIVKNNKIYGIKFIIPKDDEEYYTLYEIDCEDWCINEYNKNLKEKINDFNKINPIPLENIEYKLLILLKEKFEFYWKEI